MSETTELLTRINSILASHKERSSAHSDRFNIFQVLNITTDEVRLHSKFLAELLDPNGTHEKGGIFLNRFLELTGSTGLFNPEIPRLKLYFQYNSQCLKHYSGHHLQLPVSHSHGLLWHILFLPKKNFEHCN
jgi:hypothetical protein